MLEKLLMHILFIQIYMANANSYVNTNLYVNTNVKYKIRLTINCQ